MYENDILVAKECRGCNQLLPITSFTRKRCYPDGYEHRCTPCRKAAYPTHATDDRRKRWIITRIKSKCKRQNIPFSLTAEDIIIPDRCPVLGIPLVFGRGARAPTDNSPSVDRVIPSLGYIKGNVIVISQRANRIKNDATREELVRVLEYLNYQDAYDSHSSKS